MSVPATANAPKVINKPKKKMGLGRYLYEYWPLYLLVAPAIIYYAIFAYGPMYGAQIAFKNYRAKLAVTGSEWIGLKHFIRFVNDPFFWILLKNTLTLSIYSLIAGFPVPLILAFMINEVTNKPYKKTIQMITYAPHFLSDVVVCGMIAMFFAMDRGIVNIAIEAMGGQQREWLVIPAVFKHFYVWSGVWKGAGWGTIIYLASLASVDQEVVEAAVIDGATKIQRIWYIDFPTIKPTVVINLLLSLGGILGTSSEKIILLQREPTIMASETYASYLYNQGIMNGSYDYTSAAGMFQSIVNFILLSFFNWISNKLGEASLW